MFLRCLLVPTAAGIDPTPCLEAALKLGRKLHAHMDVLFVSPEPQHFLASLPAVVIAAGVTISSIEREERDAAAAGKTALEAWCRESEIGLMSSCQELDTTFAIWSEETGDLETIVALKGRVNDLTVIARPNAAEPFTERAFDAAVFSTGRPALVVPNHLPDDLLRHVVIAWNGSLEATRLISQTITLLHAADQVTVITAQSGRNDESRLADLAAYLRWHGIVAGSRTVAALNVVSIGAAILEETKRLEATMLVMGAYTHSRIHQFLLGGVTKHVIAHSHIPVLMAH